MKRICLPLNVLLALLIVVPAGAQDTTEPNASEPVAESTQSIAPTVENAAALSSKTMVLKDPVLAGYLSATFPGMGQYYAGRKGRGFLFLAGIVGAFATTAALYEPANLKLSDYDNPDFGGNGDGLLSIAETENWEKHKFEDDAFDRLSTGRKVGVITSAAAGIGLYIWNIIDARRQARAHNEKIHARKIDLGLQVGPERSGLALQVHF